MNPEILELDARLQRRAGERDGLQKALRSCAAETQATAARLISVEEAQQILQLVAQETQKNIVVHISDIVTTALDAVFESDAYEFRIDFVQRRGRTEAELYFERDGNRCDPLTASGGGAVDVAAFALRVALWSLVNHGSRIADTIVLDEPFKWLSKELQPRAGEMLQLLSRKLGIQFIFVTHVQDLIESADTVFEVRKKKQVSHVEVLK